VGPLDRRWIVGFSGEYSRPLPHILHKAGVGPYVQQMGAGEGIRLEDPEAYGHRSQGHEDSPGYLSVPLFGEGIVAGQ